MDENIDKKIVLTGLVFFGMLIGGIYLTSQLNHWEVQYEGVLIRANYISKSGFLTTSNYWMLYFQDGTQIEASSSGKIYCIGKRYRVLKGIKGWVFGQQKMEVVNDQNSTRV